MLFSAPCAIYGALSFFDPLFRSLYFATLDWSPAAICRTPDGILDALEKLLAVEFQQRSGIAMLRDLGTALFAPGPRARRLTSAEVLPAFFERFFPARYSRLAAPQLAAHLAASQLAARRHGLESANAILIYQQVAFFIGSEFGSDALYPWAVKALSKDAPEDARLARLEAAIKIITDRALQANE
jgi:hypothetical protein